MLLLNFKTYQEASGAKAVNLARILAECSAKYSTPIIACVQMVDLREVVKILPNSTWAQHVDSIKRGRATGWTPAEIAKESGASGVLFNHSEHKLTLNELSQSVEVCKSLQLSTLVFASDVNEAISVAKLNPDWVGYEPPELVGSEEKSVSLEKPEVIKKVVDSVTNCKILVGAGVKSAEDVAVALKLGAHGVGVASGVIKAEDPKMVLQDLLQAFEKQL